MNRAGDAVTDDRRDEVDGVVATFVAVAASDERIAAVAVCGSYATGRATMASDVDLVVFTDVRDALVDGDEWVERAIGAAGAELVRCQDWGPMLTELRYRLPSGLEVEVGIADLAWASVDPIDPGTRTVVADGFVARYDPTGLLAALVTAIAGAGGRGDRPTA